MRRRHKVERGDPAMRIGAPGPMGRILVRGEPGHDIIAELYPATGEPVIDKPGKGAFYQTDLDLMLRNRGIDTLFVCGVTTEVCVNTTVREANDRGYRCIVLSDCCASYFPEFHEIGPEDGQGAGRHFRFGGLLARTARRHGRGLTSASRLDARAADAGPCSLRATRTALRVSDRRNNGLFAFADRYLVDGSNFDHADIEPVCPGVGPRFCSFSAIRGNARLSSPANQALRQRPIRVRWHAPCEATPRNERNCRDQAAAIP